MLSPGAAQFTYSDPVRNECPLHAPADPQAPMHSQHSQSLLHAAQARISPCARAAREGGFFSITPPAPGAAAENRQFRCESTSKRNCAMGNGCPTCSGQQFDDKNVKPRPLPALPPRASSDTDRAAERTKRREQRRQHDLDVAVRAPHPPWDACPSESLTSSAGATGARERAQSKARLCRSRYSVAGGCSTVCYHPNREGQGRMRGDQGAS